MVPTRVGQGYVFEAPPPEQDEYDIPRHLLAPGPQDIYDVPPVRGLLPGQCSQEVGVRAAGGVLSSPCPGRCAVQAQPAPPGSPHSDPRYLSNTPPLRTCFHLNSGLPSLSTSDI